jgi:hypothetical protein
VGIGIAAMNAGAAREVWCTACEEHIAASERDHGPIGMSEFRRDGWQSTH